MTGGDLFVGLMSGTSLDGVDAALVSFDGAQPSVLGTHYLPYPDAIRQLCLALQSSGFNELHDSACLAIDLARLYAAAVNALLAQAGVHTSAVRAIGCHGQTVRHDPVTGYSLQINQPSLLAELSGIAVVSDFRSRDMAAGGQGAPLVPAFHEAVFRSTAHRRVVVNIGGISNLTDLPPGGPTSGFDCGPGNILMDAWIEAQLCERFDADGAWAACGTVLPGLLNKWLEHPFFATKPPKSCGREQFNLSFVESALSGNESPEDVQRTLLELTATSISAAVCESGDVAEVLLCGGGTRNGLLRERLAALMPAASVRTTDEFGVSADWLEAVAFAWLARQRVLGLPGNLPKVTGARGPRVLGAIYPA